MAAPVSGSVASVDEYGTLCLALIAGRVGGRGEVVVVPFGAASGSGAAGFRRYGGYL